MFKITSNGANVPGTFETLDAALDLLLQSLDEAGGLIVRAFRAGEAFIVLARAHGCDQMFSIAEVEA